MYTYASILALIEELEGDVREIERLLKRNRTAWARIEAGANDPVVQRLREIADAL